MLRQDGRQVRPGLVWICSAMPVPKLQKDEGTAEVNLLLYK